MPLTIIDLFDQLYAGKFFYMLYFQEPGVAEAAFQADLRAALKRVYFALSGAAPVNSLLPGAPRDAALLPLLPAPPDGPLSFISDADLDRIVASFEHTGLTGAFNRYRALTFDVEASSDIVGATVDQPSCFIAGELDPVRAMIPGIDSFADPGAGCTDFRGTTLISDAGHWVQQEAPNAVNDALDTFLDSI
jgi:pimeloyl-ACP methyl ester carboxylesterase